ncbi:MAG TPA: GDP-mannose 4,6-dehydratase [Gemmatimonadales bacterium]|nr:GDP-mannose 4,6-dehydratase [Gemmatimonadales bacterium]
MRVLVTGADGFVGGFVVRALLASGHEVIGTERPGQAIRPATLAEEERRAVRWQPLELGDLQSVRQAAQLDLDAVIHLAAVASGGDALKDPGVAWAVNAAGTARLLNELGRRRAAGEGDPVVLLVSTAEVYGSEATRPLLESDPVRPRSPYAASKAGAELAARETAMRTGLKVIVARSFPHTGPGQDERFVAPAFARRLRGARLAKARIVKVGNLEPVRDILDVRDVAAAYLALLERGTPGEVYNVCSGRGISLRELFDRLAGVIGVDAIPECDPEFLRPADIAYLVGNPAKLVAATGWRPTFELDQTLRDLVDAQAD